MNGINKKKTLFSMKKLFLLAILFISQLTIAQIDKSNQTEVIAPSAEAIQAQKVADNLNKKIDQSSKKISNLESQIQKEQKKLEGMNDKFKKNVKKDKFDTRSIDKSNNKLKKQEKKIKSLEKKLSRERKKYQKLMSAS